MVELGGIKLSKIAPFNQYFVGFDNPFYPQNYPQKLSGKYCFPAPDVRGSLAEVIIGK